MVQRRTLAVTLARLRGAHAADTDVIQATAVGRRGATLAPEERLVAAAFDATDVRGAGDAVVTVRV
jgi:hypothetical protein